MFVLTNGLIAGLGLAAFLALGDGLFDTNTFPVLIDVSYVPGMENLPSIVELLIHLLISVIVAFFSCTFTRGNEKPDRYDTCCTGCSVFLSRFSHLVC